MELVPPQHIAELADVMHKHGVRKLRCGDIELEAGDAPRKMLTPEQREEQVDEAEELRKRREKMRFGAST